MVSATLCSEGLILANITVLELPPRLSFSSIVSGEERKGTWPFPVAQEQCVTLTDGDQKLWHLPVPIFPHKGFASTPRNKPPPLTPTLLRTEPTQ